MKINIIIALFLLMASSLHAAELLTKSYKISITRNCEEYNVTCDDVDYYGVHKKTGKSIKLKGSTWHIICADGVTPCQFIGYIFKNGNTTYQVYEKGLLEVRSSNKVLLSEEGKWQ